MPDNRTDEEIERGASHLHSIYAEGFGWDRDSVRGLWDQMTDSDREGWRTLARAVRGVIHHEDATSGGFPTANQADSIRDLRESYPKGLGWVEESYISSATRPYGEMVVKFENNKAVRVYLIHPDGHYEELHKEKVSA